MDSQLEIKGDVAKELGYLYNAFTDKAFPEEKVKETKIRGYLSCAIYGVVMRGNDIDSNSTDLRGIFKSVSEFKDIEMDVRRHRNDDQHEEFVNSAIDKARGCVEKTKELFGLDFLNNVLS